jgi:hypothetical protein
MGEPLASGRRGGEKGKDIHLRISKDFCNMREHPGEVFMGKRELGCFGHGWNSCRRSAESDLARILRSSEWGVKVGQGGGDEDEVDRSAMPRGLQVAGAPRF